jgi:hypothetical protein
MGPPTLKVSGTESEKDSQNELIHASYLRSVLEFPTKKEQLKDNQSQDVMWALKTEPLRGNRIRGYPSGQK